MSTSAPVIAFDNSSTTTFRAWGSAVSAALAATGLVKTSDTGQVDWTTVTLGASLNTAYGYEIWQLNDSQQAGNPVYMKIEYGTGSTTTRTVMWVTFSTLTNGAGTMIGALTSSRYLSYNSSAITSTPQQCYFAGDGSYLMMILCSAYAGSLASSASPLPLGIFFDRTRDATGAITSDGFQWAMATGETSYHQNAERFSAYTSSSANDVGINSNVAATYFTHGIMSFRIHAIGAVGQPAGTSSSATSGAMLFQVPYTPQSSAQYAGDTYFFPQLITTPNVSYGLLMLAGYSNDLGVNYTTTTAPVLGSTHTYLVTPYDFTAIGGQGSTMRMLVRYE